MPAMAMVQIFIGAPAFIISLVVAYATFVQADATKKIQEASAWPFIDVALISTELGPDAKTGIAFTNSGLGPALIRRSEILLDGAPVADWEALAESILAEAGETSFRVSWASFPRVMRAGQSVETLRVEEERGAAALLAALSGGRIAAELCYCSVYERCWRQVFDLSEASPVEIESCAPPPDETALPDGGDALEGRS